MQVRDFGLVFDALTHFEESLLAAKMTAAGDEEPEEVSFILLVMPVTSC